MVTPFANRRDKMGSLTLKNFSLNRPSVQASLRSVILISLPILTLLFTLSTNPLHSRDLPPQPAVTSSSFTLPPGQNREDTAGDNKDIKFCELPGNCIFDVGHNTGQDTAFYLRDPKARVLAVEANPALVEGSRSKFAREIEEGRLRLISVGLTEGGDGGGRKTKFWINKNSKFSSFLEHLGCRDGWGKVMEEGDHTFCESIELETKTCRELVEEYGTPVYLKIDIEGMDKACIESVGEMEVDRRPKYLSVENVHKARIERLEALGYDGFKVVNQLRLEDGIEQDLMGYSGPWGDEAVDDERGKEWVGGEVMKTRLPLVTKVMVEGKEMSVWYDLHARKGQERSI